MTIGTGQNSQHTAVPSNTSQYIIQGNADQFIISADGDVHVRCGANGVADAATAQDLFLPARTLLCLRGNGDVGSFHFFNATAATVNVWLTPFRD